MKVRMTVSMHGPDTAREPHDVVEVGDDEGGRLIAAGFAEPHDDEPKAEKKKAPAKKKTSSK